MIEVFKIRHSMEKVARESFSPFLIAPELMDTQRNGMLEDAGQIIESI